MSTQDAFEREILDMLAAEYWEIFNAKLALAIDVADWVIPEPPPVVTKTPYLPEWAWQHRAAEVQPHFKRSWLNTVTS